MSQSLSLDIRKRVVSLLEDGFSCREIGRRLCISAASAVRIAQKHRRGEPLAPHKRGRKRGTGRLEAVAEALRAQVEAQPDITMPELAAALEQSHGVRAAPAELSRFLRYRLGYTYKKIADRDGASTPAGAPRAIRVASPSDAEDAG